MTRSEKETVTEAVGIMKIKKNENVQTIENIESMETMGDEDLARLARGGCEDAFALLVHRYAPMVKRQVAALRCPQMETEDLAQEGLMGLLSAVRTYASGNASFRTYASVCVHNRILSEVKHSNAARLIPPSVLISMDDEQEEPLAFVVGGDDPAQLVVQKEDTLRLHGRLRELLSPKEYDVLMYYLKAYAYEEIAQLTKMSPKAVDNALQRVRRKLVSVSLLGG